jgi:signal transduction histidine kinase
VKERTVAVGQARKESDDMRRSLSSLQEDLARADATVADLQSELEAERVRTAENEDVTLKAERDRAAQQARAEKLVRQLEEAAAENAELNRRLQDAEARRQLELADDQGRAQIDQLLRVTQERLAGQTEKLIAAEDRVKALETDLGSARGRLEVVEGDLRMHQMSDALRETREPEGAEPTAEDAPRPEGTAPAEDRRATSPFMKELSVDAKRSVAKINGITQLLKHKKDGKDQAQLIKQLTAYARKLDHTVADLADAERLVSGSIDLNIRRTDLESLVARVVEEAAVDSDHDLRVVSEPVKARVDPLRVEQILHGMLRTSSERTQGGKTIVVRLQQVEGGAQLSVEDPEPSSDASISPIVRRLTEVLGGSITTESRDGGGSAFRVVLPDGDAGTRPVAAAPPDVQIVVDTPVETSPAVTPAAAATPDDEPWEAEAAHKQLAAELRRLAELQDK